MASLAVRVRIDAICNKTNECLNKKHSGPVFICKAQSSNPELQSVSKLRFSNRSIKETRRASCIVMGVAEGAATEAEGGLIVIEDEATLDRYLEEAGDKLVVLSISTASCGPCKMIHPKLVKMSKDYPDAVFLKIMGDLNKETRALMRKWEIRAVPSFRFFRNQKVVHIHSGANEDELRAHFIVHYKDNAQC
ncbi:hypothetical protein KP509_37G049100 [Ceratopteris richardii]|uniref:Thioredoxin domain-containing protein n=1 Tax=Ceratopteris richardii TaxID=49495 RepID=A0A8T2Q8P0_CERRI|nr:hypothetical protein KP509_37G049100 [Ceratopteris richardii]KAH7280026.1 hypothetical protein KP509_37G049100 [Ceratopteris richardii]